MIRHLCYHVYPVASNGVWRWNLDHLRRRLDLFNGKRVVAVAVDAETDTLVTVKDYLAADNIDWIELENDPLISETASWVPLWERIEGQPGVTFRSHAKGVTPWNKKQVAKVRGFTSNYFGKCETRYETTFILQRGDTDATKRIESKRYWAQMLYEGCLDYWPLVERALEAYTFAGLFRQIGIRRKDMRDLLPVLPPGLAWPDWLYMGSFYWVRNADFFAADWRTMPPNYYGVELWPGCNFHHSQAACLFGSPRKGITPMNYPEYTRDVLWKKFQGWKRHNAEWRTHAAAQVVPVLE